MGFPWQSSLPSADLLGNINNASRNETTAQQGCFLCLAVGNTHSIGSALMSTAGSPFHFWKFLQNVSQVVDKTVACDCCLATALPKDQSSMPLGLPPPTRCCFCVVSSSETEPAGARLAILGAFLERQSSWDKVKESASCCLELNQCKYHWAKKHNTHRITYFEISLQLYT